MPPACNLLISMLEVLFSRRTVAVKKDILKTKYGIVMMTEWEGRLNTMCNFSECFIEMGIEQGLEQGKLSCGRQNIFDLLEDLGEIPDDIHTRIAEETDFQLLRRWLKSAARAANFDAFRATLQAAPAGIGQTL